MAFFNIFLKNALHYLSVRNRGRKMLINFNPRKLHSCVVRRRLSVDFWNLTYYKRDLSVEMFKTHLDQFFHARECSLGTLFVLTSMAFLLRFYFCLSNSVGAGSRLEQAEWSFHNKMNDQRLIFSFFHIFVLI